MRSGTRVFAISYAAQFVLQIDDQLFETFAPRRLKDALDKSAKLAVPSLPTFRGLDLAPVLKFIAALALVGSLVVVIIVPQHSLLDDAKSVLCGTRDLRLRRVDRRSRPIRHTQVGR